ncbi:group III truncated hemoglobin [Methylocystis sp. 9N]|uniref:Group III truncated hemoglobin n=1 Tax=Methylocystis borbori TaxID=3118750 RepID=A0ABU7XGB6_9HYPH
MNEPDNAEIEAAIEKLVDVFYTRARQDALLGPIFEAKVQDWDAHMRLVADFWSKILLKTNRYAGQPFPAHLQLPIEPRHIDHWLALFSDTTEAILPEPYAQTALEKARMMGESFKAGLFPFIDKEGRPSRHPPA